MEVFVLVGELEYEAAIGDDVLGVYSSYEAAVTAHGVYVRDEDRHFDYYYIERRVIDAPVDDSTSGDYI